jgi:hypothetical protein
MKQPKINLQSISIDSPMGTCARVIRSELTPEEVVAAIECLLLYLPEKGKRRAIHRRAFEWARRLLNVQYDTDALGNRTWCLGDDWRERLELFGIHPDIAKVIDKERFAHVWSDIKRGDKISKHRQRLRISRGEESEPVTPLVEFRSG